MFYFYTEIKCYGVPSIHFSAEIVNFKALYFLDLTLDLYPNFTLPFKHPSQHSQSMDGLVFHSIFEIVTSFERGH